MSDDHDADRVLQLSICKNGHTWGDPRYMALPETGDFKPQLRFTRFGQIKQSARIKIEVSSPVDVTLIAMSIDAS